DDVEAERPEQFAQHVAIHGDIVDDEHRASRPGVAGDRSRRPIWQGGIDWENLQPDFEAERAAGAGLRFDGETAVDQSHQPLADREAEAGAGFGWTAVVSLLERLKQFRAIRLTDADACVRHAETHHFGRGEFRLEPHRAACGELDRVAEKIVDY